MNWFVVYVKPRNEKKVALQLEKLGLEVYCPMIIQRRQWSDRVKKIEVPLINSYVFVQLSEKEREIVFQVPGVVRYLFWLGKPAVVRNKEIEILKKWLAGDVVDATVENIKSGDSVKINSGPFQGKKGIVQKTTKNNVQLILQDLGVKITLTKNQL